MHYDMFEEIQRLKEQVNQLNFHKNLQIEENRKISRRVDKIVDRLRKWKYRLNAIEEDIKVLYKMLSDTDFKVEVIRERNNGKTKCC